jgi:hypothetical protein
MQAGSSTHRGPALSCVWLLLTPARCTAHATQVQYTVHMAAGSTTAAPAVVLPAFATNELAETPIS